MTSRNLRQSLFPVLAALIWGTAFAFQSMCTEFIGPFTFNAARSVIATAALLCVGLIFNSKKPELRRRTPEKKRADRKQLIIGGICCGVLLTAASNLQQLGIAGTSAGKTAFITTLYVVLVPVFGLFLKKRASLNVWLAVALAVAGLYLLCVKENFSMAVSDLYVLGCAVIFALHILVIDHFTNTVDGVWLSCVQFAVVMVISGVCAFVFEHPTIGQLGKCLLPLLYIGVFSSGVAYTLQILAQKDANPTVVTILLSLESVFGTLSGALILGEQMTAKEYIGCAIMFVAVIIAQLPERKRRTKGTVHEH